MALRRLFPSSKIACKGPVEWAVRARGTGAAAGGGAGARAGSAAGPATRCDAAGAAAGAGAGAGAAACSCFFLRAYSTAARTPSSPSIRYCFCKDGGGVEPLSAALLTLLEIAPRMSESAWMFFIL